MRSATLPLLNGPRHPGAARYVSSHDASVNVVDRRGYEARYVRRTAERAVIYVSPQNGCAQGCTMCWLTAQGMTRAEDARLPNLLAQLGRGLAELDAATAAGVPPPAELHVDFMGRGDALASRELPAALPGFARALRLAANFRRARPRILLSTILPRVARRVDLVDLVRGSENEGVQADVYWSWYSSDPVFRSRRMPGADDVNRSFDRIADLTSAQRRPARVHFALIPDENDDEVDAHDLLRALQARGTRARVNLVAYNPPPGETSDMHPSIAEDRAAAYMAALRASPVIERVKQILPVGRDVHAACGMFAGPSAATSTYNPDESETT